MITRAVGKNISSYITMHLVYPKRFWISIVFAFYPKTVRQTVNNSYVKFNLSVSLRERLNEVHYGQFKSGELVIFIILLYSG